MPTRTAKKPHTQCGCCGKVIPKAKAIFHGVAYCSTCYYRETESTKCPSCSLTMRKLKSDAQHPCRNCERESRRCIRCNKRVPRAGLIIDEGVVCPSCVPHFKAPKACANCGKESRRLSRAFDLGFDEPVCPSCRTAHHVTCSGCGKPRPKAGEDRSGHPLCKKCLTEGAFFLCPTCGQTGRRHSKTKCHQCYWKDLGGRRLREIEKNINNSWLKREFRLFFDHLSAHGKEQRAALILKKYELFFISLDTEITNKSELSYDLIFQVLYNENLVKYMEAISFFQRRNLLSKIEPDDWRYYKEKAKQRRILLSGEGQWYYDLLTEYLQYLLMIQRKNENKGYTESRRRPAPSTISTNLSAAQTFFDDLDINDASLIRTIDQNQLDRFLVRKPGYFDAVRPVVKYLNQEVRLFKRIKVNTLKKNIPKNIYIGQEHCRKLLNKWLNTTGLESRNALIKTLMLLYAQHPKNITMLRIRDIDRVSGGLVTLRFDGHLLKLNEDTSRLLERYLSVRTVRSSLDTPWDNPFLFPGRLSGTSLSHQSINYHLRGEGLSVNQMFASALINMYASGIKHPKVLVKAFGITLQSAMKYYEVMNLRLSAEMETYYGKN